MWNLAGMYLPYFSLQSYGNLKYLRETLLLKPDYQPARLIYKQYRAMLRLKHQVDRCETAVLQRIKTLFSTPTLHPYRVPFGRSPPFTRYI